MNLYNLIKDKQFHCYRLLLRYIEVFMNNFENLFLEAENGD